MEKILTTLMGLAAVCTAFASGSNYMVVMCNMNPATATSLAAAYSDPITGAMESAAGGCGPALAAVPANYTLANTSSAGAGTAAFVTYLFEAQNT